MAAMARQNACVPVDGCDGAALGYLDVEVADAGFLGSGRRRDAWCGPGVLWRAIGGAREEGGAGRAKRVVPVRLMSAMVRVPTTGQASRVVCEIMI
jgi:hypothetical protein